MCNCLSNMPLLVDSGSEYNYLTNSYEGTDELVAFDVYRSLILEAEIFANITGVTMPVFSDDSAYVDVNGESFIKASRLAQVVGHMAVAKAKIASGLTCAEVYTPAPEIVMDSQYIYDDDLEERLALTLMIVKELKAAGYALGEQGLVKG